MGPKGRKSLRNANKVSKAGEGSAEEKEEIPVESSIVAKGVPAAPESTTNGVEDSNVVEASENNTDPGKGEANCEGDTESDSQKTCSKSKDDQKKINDDVPELDDATPQLVQTSPQGKPRVLSVKLRKSISKVNKNDEDDDFIEEVPLKEKEMIVVEIPDDDNDKPIEQEMTVIDEVTEGDDEDKPVKIKIEVTDDSKKKESKALKKVSLSEKIDPDTEMVSEDELPAENSKEPLDTEAVSDEELVTDLPETEAVSEDELPPESSDKKKKLKGSSNGVSEGKDVSDASKSSDEDKKGVKRKLSAGDAKSSTTESASQQITEENPPSTKKVATEEPEKPAESTELEKYWKAVKNDPTDFTGWTYLLQFVDQENEVEAAREAYDAFLSHYPYCYGYWRKYADYEKRKGNLRRSEQVFEQGLKAIPLSVDLWIHYLNYCKATYLSEEDYIRVQFQKAIDACGLEFRSDRVWDSFIKWETEGKNVHNVTKLYDKLLKIPTQNCATHFDNFVQHVTTNQPSKVLSVDEFLSLRHEVLQVLKQYDTPISTTGPTGEGPPGEDDPPPGEEPPEADSKKADEETTALRERIISIRRKVHKSTLITVAQRFSFEGGIKRPYFHVKPLEKCQLKNWKDYLNYEILQGDKERIITLFERCLIACALYEEFWLKYLNYLQENAPEMKEKISDVYERLCTIHHKKKAYLHWHWAVWEESSGNIPKAREILSSLDETIPGLTQIAFKRINLERRAGNYDEVCRLYEHFMTLTKTGPTSDNLTIKYSRFCCKTLNDVDKAIEILKKAMDEDPEKRQNPRFSLQLIDMAMQRSPVIESEVVDIIDLYMALNAQNKEEILVFALKKVEFLEEFGTDVKSLEYANEEYRYCLKAVKEKRKAMELEMLEIEKERKKMEPSVAVTGSGTGTGPVQTPTTTLGGGGPPTTTNYSHSQNTSHPPPNYGPSNHSGYGGPPVHQQTYYQQPPYSVPPQYNQSDANYNYNQNWNYSQQPNYNYNNQGWGGYNYY